MRLPLALLLLSLAACGGSEPEGAGGAGGSGGSGGGGGSGGTPIVACTTEADCAGGPCVDGTCGRACAATSDCPGGQPCRLREAGAFCEPPPAGSLPVGAACGEGSVCSAGACRSAIDPLCDTLLTCQAGCEKDLECRRECHSIQPLDCQACAEEWEACADQQGCRTEDGLIDFTCAAACDAFYQPCFVGASVTCSPLCRDDSDCPPGRACVAAGSTGRSFCEPSTCDRPAGGVELCDGLDDDCDGEVDESMVCTETGISELDLGTLDLPGSCTDLVVEVPEGASSFLLELGDLQGSKVAACRVTDPGGDRQPLVESAIDSDGTLAVLVPHTPRVAFQPGTWTFSLRITSGGARTVRARALVREAEVPELATLRLAFFLVGVPGMSASSARIDPDFTALLERTRIVYRKAGVVLRDDWEVHDVTGDELTRFTTIDSFNAYDSEVAQLVALSERAGDPAALPVFLVHEIAGGFGSGISPGIPGPVGHGTDRSGVIVAFADDWRDRRGALGVAVAHEIGHMLGLYHPSEKDGSRHDPLDDTPECTSARDRNGDGTLSSQECAGAGADDFMFWQINRYQQSTVTPDQAFVIRRSPWVNGAAE